MRVCVIDGRTTLAIDGRAVDVERASAGRIPAEVSTLFDHWDEIRSLSAQLTDVSDHPALDEARLELPLPRPRQAFGVGVNYQDHAAEAAMDLPPVPMIFAKFVSSIAGPQDEVELTGDSVDWEAELVLVIGRDCRNVDADRAWEVVAGFCVGQDISDRTVQFEGGKPPQFNLGKSAPGFGPVGPWLVSADEFSQPLELDISCRVNGVEKQASNTRHLIFDVPAVVSFLSSRVQLCAGDIVFTGTPDGVGLTRQPPEFLQAGDEIETTIESIGTLVTRIAKR